MSGASSSDRDLERPLAGRVVLVRLHATARGVDDQDAAVAAFLSNWSIRGAISLRRSTAFRLWWRSHMSQTMIAVALGPTWRASRARGTRRSLVPSRPASGAGEGAIPRSRSPGPSPPGRQGPAIASATLRALVANRAPKDVAWLLPPLNRGDPRPRENRLRGQSSLRLVGWASGCQESLIFNTGATESGPTNPVRSAWALEEAEYIATTPPIRELAPGLLNVRVAKAGASGREAGRYAARERSPPRAASGAAHRPGLSARHRPSASSSPRSA